MDSEAGPQRKIWQVGLIGATGWIGSEIRRNRAFGRYKIVPFSRREQKGFRRIEEDGKMDLRGIDAVINLAGESIEGRWTEAKKEKILASRVDFTRNLVEQMGRMPAGERPGVLLNASAVGYYGDRGEKVVDEDSKSGEADDFLVEVCEKWEAEAKKAEEIGLRVVFLRTGIVLGQGGGAWKPLRKTFKLGLGGKLGDGEQWMPWIHLEDEVAAIAHCLAEPVSGPANLVAPGAVKNVVFTKLTGQALGRPTILPVPAFALKALLGEFADQLLGGVHVHPNVLKESGFEFKYPSLALALGDLTREG